MSNGWLASTESSSCSQRVASRRGGRKVEKSILFSPNPRGSTVIFGKPAKRFRSPGHGNVPAVSGKLGTGLRRCAALTQSGLCSRTHNPDSVPYRDMCPDFGRFLFVTGLSRSLGRPLAT